MEGPYTFNNYNRDQLIRLLIDMEKNVYVTLIVAIDYNTYINFKYILIDIYRYKPEDLLELGSMISSVFYLDTSRNEDIEIRLKKFKHGIFVCFTEKNKIYYIFTTYGGGQLSTGKKY